MRLPLVTVLSSVRKVSFHSVPGERWDPVTRSQIWIWEWGSVFWQAHVLFTCAETLPMSLAKGWFWVCFYLVLWTNESAAYLLKSRDIMLIRFVCGDNLRRGKIIRTVELWGVVQEVPRQEGGVTGRCFLSGSFTNEFDDTQALVKMIDRNVITKSSSNLAVGYSLRHWSTRQVANWLLLVEYMNTQLIAKSFCQASISRHYSENNETEDGVCEYGLIKSDYVEQY